MSLWKCATHSSLGNFSCTDERGRELWVWQFGGNGKYNAAAHTVKQKILIEGVDTTAGELYCELRMRLRYTKFSPKIQYLLSYSVFAFVQYCRFAKVACLSSWLHQSLSLWAGYACFLAVRPEGLCVNRQLRAKHCHNTMGSDKRTN